MASRILRHLALTAAFGAGLMFSSASQAGYNFSGGCFMYTDYDYSDPVTKTKSGKEVVGYRRYEKMNLVFFCFPN